ncbi:MAG: hypothetical protein ACRENI_10925 [Gemmatimonadaceae bacterium]
MAIRILPALITAGAALIALPSLAQAQPAGASASPPRIGAVDGDRVTPGSWTYSIRVIANGESNEVGMRTLTVAASSYKGAPAWLVTEESNAGAMVVVDSLYVSKSGLEPLHRVLSMGPGTIVTDFSADSVTGSLTMPGGSMPIALAYTPGLVVSGGMFEMILPILPVDANWAASMDMLQITQLGASAVPVRMRVTGEETVTVPAGEIAAWTGVIESEAVTQKVWIGKKGHRLVKVTVSSPQMQGTVIETVLK